MSKEEDESDEGLSLQQRIGMITRGLAAREDKRSSDAANRTAVSIGTETTMSILSDIRSIMNDHAAATAELASALKDREAREERRHKDICALLLGLSIAGSPSAATPLAAQRTSAAPSTGVATKTSGEFYYSRMQIRSGSILLSALMAHLDAVLSLSSELAQKAAADRHYMSFNDWANVCNAVLVKGARRKQGYRVPKPQDEDFKRACSIIATETQARTPRPDIAHFVALSSSCSALLLTVEWLRKALIECKGILSPIREARLSSTQYPFVNEQGNVLVQIDHSYESVDELHCSKVQALGVPGKKYYIGRIMEYDEPVDDAIRETYVAHKPKTVK